MYWYDLLTAKTRDNIKINNMYRSTKQELQYGSIYIKRMFQSFDPFLNTPKSYIANNFNVDDIGKNPYLFFNQFDQQ